MSAIAFHRAFRELRRSQWLDPGGLRALQERKLRAIVRHAYDTVPFHRRRFDEAGLDPGTIRTLDDLERIPTMTKRDLQSSSTDMISSRFAGAALTAERTSGSTGQPVTIRLDRRFKHLRDALFLRALTMTGYRWGRPALLLTADRRAPRRLLRWHYASIEERPESLLETIERRRPSLLYGPVTPLRQLARHLERTGGRLAGLRSVLTTAERLDQTTRRLFAERFQAALFDLYGMTETGMIGGECAAHDGLHIAEDVMIMELPAADHDGESPVVVTNLELFAMPLIRFETGDLAVARPPGRCGCGRSLRRIDRLAGRSIEAIRRPDGSELSPYRLTLALEKVDGIDRYQIVQTSSDRITLRIESEGALPPALRDDARRVLQAAVGSDMRIEVEPAASLDPPAGRKFRVVERRAADGAQP